MTHPDDIAGYTLLRRIGAGGSARVYEAIDPSGAHVALKVFDPHTSLVDDGALRERAHRECSALVSVHHPGVVGLVDAELDDTPLFIATELIDGPTLRAEVKENGVFTRQELCDLAVRLADALDAVHAAGVVHRDLKPGNVMFRPDGQPVLIDFGIAQMEADDRLTRTGAVAQTAGYCDPAVVRGEAEPDAAGDWWALTAVLVYAATGRDPFGTGADYTVLYRTLNGAVDVEGFPEEAVDAVERMLCEPRGQRPEFREILEALGAEPGTAVLERTAALAPVTLAPAAPEATTVLEPNLTSDLTSNLASDPASNLASDPAPAEDLPTLPRPRLFHALPFLFLWVLGSALPLIAIGLTLVASLAWALTGRYARQRIRYMHKKGSTPGFGFVLLHFPGNCVAACVATVLSFAIGLAAGCGVAYAVSHFMPDALRSGVIAGWALALAIVWTLPLSRDLRQGLTSFYITLTPSKGYTLSWWIIFVIVCAIAVALSPLGMSWLPLSEVPRFLCP